MDWRADHTSSALPEVIRAVTEELSCGSQSSYGLDKGTSECLEELGKVFQVQDASELEIDALMLTTGTAANCLALACLVPSYGMIFCADCAHLETSECGAPEHFTSGAKLKLVPTWPNGKMKLQELEEMVKKAVDEHKFPHEPKASVISVTQPTEAGACYSTEELDRVSALAKRFGLRFHMDGARFANAVARTRLPPCELTWKRGVHAMTFGTTKNGTLCCETIVFFLSKSQQSYWLPRSIAEEARYRQKRGGLLLEKTRFLSAQLLGYLRHGVWLEAAATANEMAHVLATRLAEIPKIKVLHPVETNMVFLEMPISVMKGCVSRGHVFSLSAGSAAARGRPSHPDAVTFRICTQWSTNFHDVQALVDCVREFATS